MSIQSAADAMSGAAVSVNAAAAALTDAAGKIGALNDTSALDQPVADLQASVTALDTAAAAVVAAVTPPAP